MWGWWCCEKNLRGYAVEGKEDEMRGVGSWRVKIFWGGLDHTKKSRGGGSVENYVFFRGGQILNGITQCKKNHSDKIQMNDHYRI